MQTLITWHCYLARVLKELSATKSPHLLMNHWLLLKPIYFLSKAISDEFTAIKIIKYEWHAGENVKERKHSKNTHYFLNVKSHRLDNYCVIGFQISQIIRNSGRFFFPLKLVSFACWSPCDVFVDVECLNFPVDIEAIEAHLRVKVTNFQAKARLMAAR